VIGAAGQDVSLAAHVAARTGVAEAVVAAVMAAHGVAGATAPAPHRSLRVARLRLAGTKTGVTGEGPFDRTFTFPTGVLMAVAPNLRGKSSLLEIITLCLRGTGRDLQADVAAWLHTVECDVELNDVALGIRLTLDTGDIVTGTIHQTSTLADLPAAIPSARPVVDAHSGPAYADAVEALMLDRLDLEPLHATDKQVGLQVHGWPSYFGALYPPAGGDKVLIGETPMAGLAGRLLSVFLDLPRAAVLTRVKTALSNLKAEAEASQPTASARTAELRAGQEEDLRQAQQALAALPTAPGPSASDAATRVVNIGARLADAERAWLDVARAYRQAKADRQEDERALNTARETAVAARLFHGLDPVSCPRCEAPVQAKRKAQEVIDHVCAICTTPLTDVADEDAARELIEERERALSASRAAEQAGLRALEAGRAETTKLNEQLRQGEADLAAARTARETGERVALEGAIARAEGALAVLAAAEEPPKPVEPNPALLALTALADELEKEMKAASSGLLEELGDEIGRLARDFGIHAVSKVTVDLRGILRIDKGGVSAGTFSTQSPGERLRLRIATVVALLRVGGRRGIATHPGLLMIDSLRAEEVQESDAHALLDSLIAVAGDTPGFQILTTTQDERLPTGRLTDDHVLRPDDGGELW
jgi:hypothetical protein